MCCHSQTVVRLQNHVKGIQRILAIYFYFWFKNLYSTDLRLLIIVAFYNNGFPKLSRLCFGILLFPVLVFFVASVVLYFLKRFQFYTTVLVVRSNEEFLIKSQLLAVVLYSSTGTKSMKISLVRPLFVLRGLDLR